MTHSEFTRLRKYQLSSRRAPRWNGMSKRTAKKGRVQVLKNSRIISHPIESVYTKPNWVKHHYK